MKSWTHLTGLLLLVMAVTSGCRSNVWVEEQFPEVVSKPRDLTGALLMDEEFRNYRAQPNESTSIMLGPAQAELLSKAFAGLFERLLVVSSREEIRPDVQMVIIPTVREVQVSTPSDSYLNMYEVWIKYNLDIETSDGVPIDSWFLPAYGKTPYSNMLSRGQAIEEAAVIALRDAGAKLMLDFFRIPAVHGYLQQNPTSVAER